jgi:RHS repeat-associated protein
MHQKLTMMPFVQRTSAHVQTSICAVRSEPVSGIYTMTQYIYDAEGNRVAKGNITDWSAGCDTTKNGFTPTNSYVLGPSGEVLTETDGNGNWIRSNVYAAGILIATYDTAPTGQPALHFQLEDWLGARRVQTDISGNPEEAFTSLPYGDQLAATPVSGAPPTADDATPLHFTFINRYYDSSMGRFLTPDPSGLLYADPTNPQSLNLYSYVLNNPLSFIDPFGLDCVYFNDSGNGIESVDRNSNSGECGSNGGTGSPALCRAPCISATAIHGVSEAATLPTTT